MQHHHGLSPGDHKRQHNEDGLKVAQQGCGRTHVALAQAQPRQVGSNRCPKGGSCGVAQVQCIEGRFGAFHEGMSLFQRPPSSPSIKGGSLLFI
jgi:hypothetical protein